MGLSVNVVGSIANDKAIVSEKKISKNQVNEKFYLVNKDNADKFVKQRKRLEHANSFQTGISFLISCVLGSTLGSTVKFGGAVGRFLAGLDIGLTSMILLGKFDKAVDKFCQKTAMKQLGAKEVSKEELAELEKTDFTEKPEQGDISKLED